MPPHLVGDARVSSQQDLTSQQAGLTALGVPDDLVYVDRERPGLDQALAACPALPCRALPWTP